MSSYYRLLPALALALLATTGCADDGGPVFNNEGGRQISCMQHQPEPPGSRYSDAERRNPGEVLAVLRYYTAHGTQPYCDGAAPTEVDRAWAELYVQVGADRSKV
ncbi:MAG: hypothetical protein ACRDSN_00050, partial [Pseudonocardiaceae bacterium]